MSLRVWTCSGLIGLLATGAGADRAEDQANVDPWPREMKFSDGTIGNSPASPIAAFLTGHSAVDSEATIEAADSVVGTVEAASVEVASVEWLWRLSTIWRTLVVLPHLCWL